MRAYTYVSPGTFAWMDKPKPVLQHPRDAIVRVTLASICTSDLHIKHGAVPRAVPGITLGHEMVGIVRKWVPPFPAFTPAIGLPSMWRPSAGTASSAATGM